MAPSIAHSPSDVSMDRTITWVSHGLPYVSNTKANSYHDILNHPYPNVSHMNGMHFFSYKPYLSTEELRNETKVLVGTMGM